MNNKLKSVELFLALGLATTIGVSSVSIINNVLAKPFPPVQNVPAKYAEVREKEADTSITVPLPEMAKTTNRFTINGGRTANKGLNTSRRSCLVG